VRESLRSSRQCGSRIVRGQLCRGNSERSTWVYTVDGEDIRSSGLVNGRLVMDYAPRCHCGVQVDR
jgi:hypothetical protein